MPASIDLATRIRYVLVRTSHPGNIGSAARAIRTMGFTRLELVRPARFPDAEASALAAGADDVLGQAGIHDGLVESLAGSRLVLGLSARRRGINLPEISPREAAAREPKGTPLFTEERKPSFDVDDDVLDIPSFLRDR